MNDFDYNELTKLRKIYIDGIVEHGGALGIDLARTPSVVQSFARSACP